MTSERSGRLEAAKLMLREARKAMHAFDNILSELRPNDLKDYIEETHTVSQSIAAMLMCIDDDCAKNDPPSSVAGP